MRELSSFREIHQDQPVIICGCGESLNDLASPEKFVTIGVNDVGRKFQPNYLVVVNPPEQFSGDRFRYVENSTAEYLFTQLDLGVNHPNIVKFRLGTFGGTDFFDPNVLHYTNNSPYIALCLAILMGARRVGLIGVDFTDHHFFGETGAHPLAPQFDSINEQYCRLAEAAGSGGVEIFNLSRISRLTAFPKISVDEFAAADPPARAGGAERLPSEKSSSLKIVSYATTPVAGVPAILARCINARTAHSARCVWATSSYGNGVRFTGDVEWQNEPQRSEDLLSEADLIIAHNGKVAPEHEKFFTAKPVVTMAHNYLWNVDERFVKQDFAGVVVGQYQAALEEFKNWTVVPNPVPFWEGEYRPEEKGEQITICYTPSGKHEKYPPEHQLYWHSKGYETTVSVLERLARRFPVRLEVIRDRQIPHAESLLMKRRSHIVIDECVTGSYHRNSLEGLAGGAVVINGLGILPKVIDVLRLCAGDEAEIPFVPATLENLEEVLIGLIEGGRERLVRKGAENRRWIENHWDFSRQWERFWIPAIEKSFRRLNRPVFIEMPEAIQPDVKLDSNREKGGCSMKESKNGVSIVIPHGGRYRRRHLRACLANLRQCADVAEIIVVEMDDRPRAVEVARRWADKYVFMARSGAFEKGRALNMGSLFASAEFVLWLDNDLLMETDFFTRAIAEMRRNELDYLKPYTETYYLSAADSERVMQGVVNPEACRPVNIDRTLPCGRAEIMRRDFLRRVGGIPDGFRGWGGEDNAWAHKANVLGRSGTMPHGSQKLFHLFHLLSGGYSGGLQIAANPHYRENVALLDKIYAVRDEAGFRREFPPQKYTPWNSSKKIVFAAGKVKENLAAAQAAAREFEELFGAAVEIIPLSGGAAKYFARLANKQPDAVVFFDAPLGIEFLSEKSYAEFGAKTILIAGKNFDFGAAQIYSPVILAENVWQETAGQNSNIWFWNDETPDKTDFQALALTLAQTLSLILATPPADIAKNAAKSGRAKNDLPVWFYWEGPRPAWIEACHQTIVAKNANARFITPETFDELWTKDRDIEIGHLYVAHRADFMRAYLLANFGGLWLDADCLVMRDLQFLLDRLDQYDFIAHRERNGLFTNDFLAARRGSVIALRFYERICQTLRATRSLSWREIGGDPLTEILHRTDAHFLELPCEAIQPICWSEPEKFFAAASDALHECNFEPEAICYMLSNGAVNTYKSKNPHARLTAENTFFNFLVRRALRNDSTDADARAEVRKNGVKQNGNRLKTLSFYLEMIAKIAPRKVLDADVGSGRWAVLLRDFFESADGAPDSPLDIEAFVETKPANSEALRHFYDRLNCGKLEERFEKTEEIKDLVILGDYLTRNGNFRNPKVLDVALNKADYALLSFYAPQTDVPPSGSERNLLDFLGANGGEIAAINKSENIVSVLLSRRDPKNIRPPSNFAEVFCQTAEDHRRQGEESLSGPGCSRNSTAEIRRRLPLLFSSLGINSVTDARCGDFNWQQHVDLRLKKYFGVDIVPALIEQNRKLYETGARRFMVADVRKDFLPEADLILCRDLLVHLSFADIYAALRNFSGSGAKYLLTTTFPNAQKNSDIPTGDWRTLNFELPPFNFCAPFKLINERCPEGGGLFADKSLGLWLLSDIERSID